MAVNFSHYYLLLVVLLLPLSGNEWFTSPRSVHASLGLLFSMAWAIRDVGRGRETPPTDLPIYQENSAAGQERSADQVGTFRSMVVAESQVSNCMLSRCARKVARIIGAFVTDSR